VKHSGLFHLQTPRDLLAKARHDLERMRFNSLDAYAAFDFFATVRHLPDWLYPGEEPEQKQRIRALFDSHYELRVARHIADRAKHFEATYDYHRQSEGTSVMAGYQITGNAFQPGFQGETLAIKLDARDPDTVSLGEWVNALELAERVFRVAELIVGPERSNA
jgi:hypothetical protein